MLADLSNGLLSASQWAAARCAVNHQKANKSQFEVVNVGKIAKGKLRGGCGEREGEMH